MDHERPIILIGTQRSGTTWLGRVFSAHPDLAYWPEPRHVWTWGNGYKPDDLLTERDARPKVVRRIRRTFERFVREQGKRRLMEKTPSNCLRVRFIHAVYPRAKIVCVVRDGRSVIRSTRQILAGGVPSRRILRRAAETPLWEWPAYLPRAASTIYRKIARRPLDYWGPRPPGWRDWVRTDPTPVVMAKQWSATIRRAVDDGRPLGDDVYFEFRYEQLTERPRETMERIAEFADLPRAGGLIDEVARTADPERGRKWRAELDDETLDLIRPHMEPTLRYLGYEW